MTGAAHPSPRDEAVAALTGPGGDFEIGVEQVLGEPMQVHLRRRRSLRDMVLDSWRHEAGEYLVDGDLRISHRRHLAWVVEIADLLSRRGVRRGDRVAIIAGNRAEWIAVWWAVVSMGGIAVAVNSWWSAREVADALEDTGPALVVADVDHEALAPAGLPLLAMADVSSLLPREEPSSPPTECDLPAAEIDEDDAATILFTSGTTGRSKGAVHTHRNVICAVDFHRLNDGVATLLGRAPSGRRFLLANPLFHIAGLHNLAVPRLDIGDTAVILRGRFRAPDVLALLERERVTNWGAVPTMVMRLLEDPALATTDLSALRTMSLGTTASPIGLRERLIEAIPTVGATLGTTFGCTESSTAATLASAVDVEAHPGTAGRVIPTLQLEIRAADGRAVADGEEGEVHLRGPHVMAGYWSPAAGAPTDVAFAPGRWFPTGDLGRVLAGQLFIVSRRTDLIIRGGENIYPAEVETVLTGHPSVREALVFGETDPELGQRVAAALVVSPEVMADREPFLADLRAYAATRLARYKTPTSWHLRTEELPRNATGKVMRREVIPHD